MVWLLDILQLLPWIGKLIAYFRHSPQKDEDKAHEVDNDVAGMPDYVIRDRLRNRWER